MEAIRTLWRMAGDVVFGVFCLLAVAILVAITLVGALALPVGGGLFVAAALLYWLASRLPMWINPNDVGRLHRWPWPLNVLLCGLIAGMLAALLLRFGMAAAAKTYAALVAGILRPILGWAVPAATCGSCAVTTLLTTWPIAEFAALLVAAILFLLFRVVGDAKRLSMIERENYPP